jgi:hypothetical protein
VARTNPYHPGVGTVPPFLAGRGHEVEQFRALIAAFPERRANVRVTGLRGVGKTVLLKEFERIAKDDPDRRWVIVRRDVTPRMNDEETFLKSLAAYIDHATKQLSALRHARDAAVKNAVGAARALRSLKIGPVGVDAAPGDARDPLVDEHLRDALVSLGELAFHAGAGVIFMFDEAHEIADDRAGGRYPLNALLAGIVAAQGQETPPLPLMFVFCGLPTLVGNLQNARSHAERLFTAMEIGSLRHASGPEDEPGDAEAALLEPLRGNTVGISADTARTVAREVDGYPYFLQVYGSQIWEHADADGVEVVDAAAYEAYAATIRDALDGSFFEGRYDEAQNADKLTLRAAAALGGEHFSLADLNEALTTRTPNANSQSLFRLVKGNSLYRTRQGHYAFTAPMFGDFLRRKHPDVAEG